MASKKFAEVKVKTKDQLKDQIMAAKKEQFNLRFQKANGQLENTARVRELRREIARAKTALALQSQAKE